MRVKPLNYLLYCTIQIKKEVSMSSGKPTKETYSELQSAYDYFNKYLFSDALPECLITLQREKRTLGYYSPKRFVNKNQDTTDEIAMNPAYFSIRTIEEILSTLVHEMVHQWQEHFGQPGRGRYHNRQWANKMSDLGLEPSDTGKEGGKRTGDSMDHYILSGGAFERVCRELITSKFRLSWADRFPPRREVSTMVNPEVVSEGESHALEELHGWGEVDQIPPEKKPTRIKLSCPGCCANVWGKPSLNIICGDCRVQFVTAE